MAETVIIDVQINQEKAIQDQVELERQIANTKKEIQDLTNATKGNVGAQRASAQTMVTLRENLKSLKAQQNALSREIQTGNKVLQTNANSIEGMRARVAQLTREWKTADVGSKRFIELRERLKLASDELKRQETAVGDNRRNVGNYNQAIQEGVNQLKNFIPGLSSVTAGLSSAQKAFQSVTVSTNLFKVALISTGIGAIVVALGTLVAAFLSTQQGIDALNKVLIPLRTVFERIIGVVQELSVSAFGRLKEAVNDPKQAMIDLGNAIKDNVIARFEALGVLGKAIAKIFTGDIAEGFQELADGAIQLTSGVRDATSKLKDFASDLSDEVSKAAEEGARIANITIKIEEAENRLVLTREKTRRQFEELKGIAADQGKSEQERIDALNKAQAVLNKQRDEELGLLNLKIEKKALEIKQNDTDRQAQKEYNELLAERDTKEADLAARSKELIAQRSGIEKRFNEQLKKQDEERKKAIDDINNSIAENADKLQQQLDEKVEAYRKAGVDEVEIARFIASEEKKILEQRSADYVKALQDRQNELELSNKIELDRVKQKYAEQATEAAGDAVRLAEIERNKQAEIAQIQQEGLSGQIQELQAILQSASATGDNGDINTLSVADAVLSPADRVRLEADLQSLQTQLAEFSAQQAETDANLKSQQIESEQTLQDLRFQNANNSINLLKGMFKEGTKLAKAAFLAEKGIALSQAIVQGILAVQKAIASPPGPPLNTPTVVATGIQTGLNIASIIGTTIKGFASGGIAFEGGTIPKRGGMITGRPHGQGGVRFDMGNQIGEADGRKGEAYIINTRHDPFIKRAASALNVQGGGKAFFDDGGVVKFADGGISANAGSSVFDQFNFGQQVLDGIAEFPTPIVTVEDINAGLHRRAKVEQRASS